MNSQQPPVCAVNNPALVRRRPVLSPGIAEVARGEVPAPLREDRVPCAEKLEQVTHRAESLRKIPARGGPRP